MSKTSFSLKEYESFLNSISEETEQFRQAQKLSFEAERKRWLDNDIHEFDSSLSQSSGHDNSIDIDKPGYHVIQSLMPGSVWKILVTNDTRIEQGEPILIMESMKTEIQVVAPKTGVVREFLCREGDQVQYDQNLFVLEEC